jgi:hypothetical protein
MNIRDLIANAKHESDFTYEVKEAYQRGLWHKELLDLDVERTWSWDQPVCDFKIDFISDTGDSWHEFYRLWREKGWERESVKREGGLLQYVLRITDPTKPEGYQTLRVRLDITISTCKRVLKETKMVEEQVYETVCEDLVPLAEDLEEYELSVDQSEEE